MKYGGICAAAALAAATTLAVAACGGNGSDGSGVFASQNTAGNVTQGNAGRPANPVPILRKTGVKRADMVDSDIYGDRFADGYLGGTWAGGVNEGGEGVTAWTYSNAAAEQADLNRNRHPADGSGEIEGHLWVVSVTPVTSNSGTDSFPVPLRVIAARVGGTVVVQGS